MIKNGRDAFKNIKNKLSNIFMKKKSNKNEEYSFKVKIDGKELIIPKTGILLDPEYFNNENYIEIGKLKTFGEKMNKIENFNSEELEQLRQLINDSTDEKNPLFDFARNILFVYVYFDSNIADEQLKDKMIKLND